MIKYRYKLSDNKANKLYSERCIQGIILKKEIKKVSDWYVKGSPEERLVNFQHLVDCEQYDPQVEQQKVILAKREKDALEKKAKETDELKEVDVDEVKEEAKEEETLVSDAELSRSSKSKEYLELTRMTKKDLLEKVFSYEDQDFDVNLVKKKKKEELISMICEIENIQILK